MQLLLPQDISLHSSTAVDCSYLGVACQLALALQVHSIQRTAPLLLLLLATPY
jgi:hypothetical protein